jgi:hypothetical protein
MGRSRVVQLLDSEDEVVDAGPVGAVGPFAAVADAVCFAVETDGTADRYVGLEVQCQIEP